MFVLDTGTAFAKQGKGLWGETEGGREGGVDKQQRVAHSGWLTHIFQFACTPSSPQQESNSTAPPVEGELRRFGDRNAVFAGRAGGAPEISRDSSGV